MATGGTYLSRRLEQLFPGVLEKRYRALNFENGRLVPTVADLEAGAAEVVQELMSEVGAADIVNGDATDMPLVDVSVTEDRYRILMIGAAFSYSFDEERKAEKGNFNLTNKRMMAARRAIAERNNAVAAFGSADNKVTGTLNNASVALNNSSFNPHLIGTTSQQIADFFVDELRTMHDASNNVEFPSTALISSALWFTLIKRRITDNDSTTIKDYIEKALSQDGYDFNFVKADECSSARLEKAKVQTAGTNKDRILFYPLDPEVLERHIELPQLMPVDWQYIKDGRKIFPMFSCTTPVLVNYPGALRYVDLPKS
jgi:hypothetical protein